MTILLTAGSYAQLITVLIVFVLVLGVTAWVTRWMAEYQKAQNVNANIEIIETVRITTNKYIQLVRVGQKYMAIAVCKDTVTMLGEVPYEQLKFRDASDSKLSFKELLEKTIKMDSSDQSDTKDR
ncbi:MAG: hypothetical protein E7292_01280 [Lachnospiraceae bacterium]|nr:hypothetical protein [Lachnospiraceae bacterium]